jgi:hypothetical protein
VKRWLVVVAWAWLCMLACPLWIVGFALAWLHYVLDWAAVRMIRWGFWRPTQYLWGHLVSAHRDAVLPPPDPKDIARDAMLAKARRARKGER